MRMFKRIKDWFFKPKNPPQYLSDEGLDRLLRIQERNVRAFFERGASHQSKREYHLTGTATWVTSTTRCLAAESTVAELSASGRTSVGL